MSVSASAVVVDVAVADTPKVARPLELAAPPALSSHRIPSLDGLRALSIAAVLLGHLARTRGAAPWLARIANIGPVDLAHEGVQVFFVISGFLITGLLLGEWERTGTVSLRRFYFRRTLRIMPPAAALLLVVALAARARLTSVPPSDMLHAATYTMNYAPNRTWALGHMWSLSVEEQFYLLWPAAFLLSMRSGSRRRALCICLTVVAVVPLVRVAQFTLLPASRALIGTSFETSADAIAAGCALALARPLLEAQAWHRRLRDCWWVVPTLFVLGAVLSLRVRSGLLLGSSVMTLAIVLLVDTAVAHRDGTLGRVLNARPIAYVGTVSYSIYLWQQIFLRPHGHGLWTAFPFNVVIAFVCALGSYYLVERPALAWRNRHERPRARGARLAPIPGAPAAATGS